MEATTTTVYKIRDAEGRVRVEHHHIRKGPDQKECPWKLPDSEKWGLDGLPIAQLPLYGAHDVDDYDPDDLIILVEGEKARDALAHTDYFSCLGTICGASATPSSEVLEVARDRRICLWPDNDDQGRAHMERIAERLQGVAAEILWYEWPEAPEKGDAADHPWVVEGNRKLYDRLLTELESAPKWRPTKTLGLGGRVLIG